jgi:hypothetical protein
MEYTSRHPSRIAFGAYQQSQSFQQLASNTVAVPAEAAKCKAVRQSLKTVFDFHTVLEGSGSLPVFEDHANPFP